MACRQAVEFQPTLSADQVESGLGFLWFSSVCDGCRGGDLVVCLSVCLVVSLVWSKGVRFVPRGLWMDGGGWMKRNV